MQAVSDEMSRRERGERLPQGNQAVPPSSPLHMGWGAAVSVLPRYRWEYLIVRAAEDEHEEPRVIGVEGGARVESGTPIRRALDLLGQAEWELAAVQNLAAGWLYIFKRPVAGES